MNNSRIAIEYLGDEAEVDLKPTLRAKEAELVRIIEALSTIAGSDEWRSLTELLFTGVVEKLERDLLSEAKKDIPNQLQLARLNGQLVWAKKYADLNKLADVFRGEITNIREKLHGTT